MLGKRGSSLVLVGFFSAIAFAQACSDDSGGDDGSAGAGGESEEEGGAGGSPPSADGGVPGGVAGSAGGSSPHGGTIGTASVGGGSAGTPQGGSGNATSGGGPGQGGDSGSGGTHAGAGGSGGEPVGGEGGTGAIGGAGGSGGEGVGGEAGSGGSAGSCGPGEGLALPFKAGATPDSAWIDGSSNCVGVQGTAYLIKDGGGSDVYFTSRSGHICVAGNVPKATVIDGHWGVQVAIELNHQGGTALPYDATSNGVSGFSFTLSGTNVPSKLYVQYRVDGQGTEYCKVLTGGAGFQSFPISQGHPNCWDTVPGTSSPPPTLLSRLEFVVPASTTAAVPFDFCIDGLAAVQ